MADALPRARSGSTAVDVARACAEDARRIMRDGFGRATVAAVKGRGNVLTDTDLAVERAVIDRLRREYPEHAVLSEETSATTRSEGWMWVVDPIDGTKNFSRGIPHFGFSLALCHGSEPKLGLILHPIAQEEYLSVEGEGATLNGVTVTVRPCASVAEATVSLDMGYDGDRAREQLELALRLWPGMQTLRISGSAALGTAFVATGKWDIFVHRDLQPWDLAAGLLLVREAGGVITDLDGGPAHLFSRGIVAGGPEVHADFLQRAGLAGMIRTMEGDEG